MTSPDGPPFNVASDVGLLGRFSVRSARAIQPHYVCEFLAVGRPRNRRSTELSARTTRADSGPLDIAKFEEINELTFCVLPRSPQSFDKFQTLP